MHHQISHVDAAKTHMIMENKRFFRMAGSNTSAEDFDINDDERVPTTDSEFEPLAAERQSISKRTFSFDVQTPNAAFYRDHRNDGHPALQRPTFSQLIEQGDSYGSVDPVLVKDVDEETVHGGYNFGWIEGVFIRCTLSIFGVIMFLRLNWVFAQAGIAGGLGVIIWSAGVTTITTMSLSAISTNGHVKAGGVYFMVSRTLGADIGAVVGLTLFAAQSLAVALNLVGFAEAVTMLQSEYVFSAEWDPKIWALIALAVMFAISFLGARFEVNSQKVLLFTMILALLSFYIGVFNSKGDDSIDATGLSSTTLRRNAAPNYSEGISWVTVFGVFFPAATGISAGSSISGDLADPQAAIPKGTFLAILVTTCIYLSMGLLLAASFSPDGLINITTQICAIDISIVPGLVYAGVFAAGLSSALALLIGAPRILMAVARDDIIYFLSPWKKGYTANDEPVRGYMLVLAIAFLAIISLDLNAVSPLVTNFYLVQYGCMNYAAAAAHFSQSPSWRPSFQQFNPWVALLGCAMCGASMFMVGWITAVTTIVVCIGIYQYVVYTAPDVNWGESTVAAKQLKAVAAMVELEKCKYHVKNFRPQYLVLCGADLENRPDLIVAMKLLRKAKGVMIAGMILKGDLIKNFDEYRAALDSTVLNDHGIEGFKSVVVAPTLTLGTHALLQIAGLGKLRANTVIMGFKRNWAKATNESNLEYLEIIRSCFLTNHGVGIMRNLTISNHLVVGAKSTIDVWWLVEDGGLTVLIAHLLMKHPEYRNRCTLRVFSVADEHMIKQENERISDLLQRFRIPAVVNVVPNGGVPSPATVTTYSELSQETDLNETRAVYFMNLSEKIKLHSSKAALVVASLPVPRRTVPVRKYFTYLEMLSGDRPTMLIRGNQQTVLTYHS